MTERPSFARAGFTTVLLGIIVTMGLLTWPIRSTSYLIPAFLIVPTGALLAVQLLIDIRFPVAGRFTEGRREVATAVLWLLLMPVLLAAAGLVFGGAVYTLLYLTVRGGETWGLSGAFAAAVGCFLGAIAYFLRMPQLFAGLSW